MWWTWILSFQKSHSREIISAIGGLLTGVLVAWKWLTGWNLVNLSLSIENTRFPADSVPGMDNLVSVLKLKKGDRAKLTLENVRISVTADSVEIDDASLDEIVVPELSRNLKLTPGEEAQFAFHWQVPSKAVCKIKAEVFGRSSRLARAGVWKSTAVSIPKPPP
jgi:hypothetical protein